VLIRLPESFFTYTRVSWEGEAGRAWAESLPELVADLCGRWSLRVDGEPMHGANGIALPVRRGVSPYVLKVAWLDDELRDQVATLRRWDGGGIVRLVDESVDDGALLLERLDHTRLLRTVDVKESLTVSAGLLRRLAVPVLPSGGGAHVRGPAAGEVDLPSRDRARLASLPTTAAAASAFVASARERAARLGDPVPSATLDAAVGLAGDLVALSGDVLVNHDLHDENILAADREPWLAIDPRIMVGLPEYGVAQLLWWRLDDMSGDADVRQFLDLIVTVAGLDADVARAWTIVRSVDYWLWGLDAGLTIDPVRCARVLDALVHRSYGKVWERGDGSAE
jgi:streptomycin 6-kinase